MFYIHKCGWWSRSLHVKLSGLINLFSEEIKINDICCPPLTRNVILVLLSVINVKEFTCLWSVIKSRRRKLRVYSFLWGLLTVWGGAPSSSLAEPSVVQVNIAMCVLFSLKLLSTYGRTAMKSPFHFFRMCCQHLFFKLFFLSL